jgi:hypothetical protein
LGRPGNTSTACPWWPVGMPRCPPSPGSKPTTPRLQQRSWTADDGSARSVVEVVAGELGLSLARASARIRATVASRSRLSTCTARSRTGPFARPCTSSTSSSCTRATAGRSSMPCGPTRRGARTSSPLGHAVRHKDLEQLVGLGAVAHGPGLVQVHLADVAGQVGDGPAVDDEELVLF